MGDQKPKALNETLEILLQQVGKQTVKPEGQLQTKVSLSFRFLHKKLCPGLKGVMGRGERGHPQCVGWSISSHTGRKGLVQP